MFSPEYVKERKALDKALIMLKKCMECSDDDKFEKYSELADFLAEKKGLFLQFKKDFASIYLNCGIYFENSGHPEEALAAYANAAELENDIKYLKKYADLSERLEYWEDAYQANAKIIKIEPDDSNAWASAGYSLLRKGNTELAKNYAEKSLQLDKNCVKAYDVLLEIEGRKPEILIDRAYAQYAHGFYDDAIASAREAVEISGGKNDFKLVLSRMYLLCGMYDEALKIADDVLLTEKGREDALALKASVYLKMEDVQKATEYADEVLSKNPSNKDALKVLANLLVMRNKYEDAKKVAERYEKIHGVDIDMQMIYAEIMRNMGDKKGELLAYEKIISEDIKNAFGYYGKGRILMEDGRYGDAERYIKKACEISGKKEYWLCYAELLRRMKKYHESLKLLQEIRGNGDKMLIKARIMADMEKYGECIQICNQSGFPADEFYYLKAVSAMHLRRFEEAIESLEKIAEGWNAEELINKCRDMQMKFDMEKYARKIAEFEKEHGRLPTKEEAFRDCHVPFEKLDPILKYMEEDEDVNLNELSPMERQRYSENAKNVIASYGDIDVPIWHILDVIPAFTVYEAKLLRGYISKVMQEKIKIEVSPEIEELGRKALHLDPSERTIAGIIRKLNIGINEARAVFEFINMLTSDKETEEDVVSKIKTSTIPETPDMDIEVQVHPEPEKKEKKAGKKKTAKVKKAHAENKIEEDNGMPSDEKLETASEEISDIIERIEKKEMKKISTIDREMCDICGKVIATISHECGGNFCSRCVIEYNKGTSGAKKCPKCNKSLAKRKKKRWRDTL